MIRKAKSKSLIRILHVLGKLDIGGAETYVMNIYRNINRSKIQFDFVVHGGDIGFYEDEIKRMGGNIYRVPRYKIFNHFKYVQAWKRLLQGHPEYRIIHSHVRSTAAIILRIAKKYGLNTICHSHSTSNGSGISSLVKKMLQKKIPKYTDYFFACSKESAIWLYGNSIANSDKCFIINNAIDSKKYIFNNKIRSEVRKKFKLNNKIVIGQVGRLTEVKNYSFSIKLLKQLVEKNSNYYFIIVGTGPLKNKIENEVLNNNLKNNVIILENRSDVNELMQAMDIYIMPSLWEGLPLALVEAQAASLPCIISSNIKDGIIIDGLTKKILLDDINEWVLAIEKLVVKGIDRVNTSKKIIDSGFDIESNVKKISEFYLNL